MEWLAETVRTVSMRDRRVQAGRIAGTYSGAAAAYHGGQAFTDMRDQVDNLLAEPGESDDEYMLDADAKPDTEAIERVKRTFDQKGDANG